MFLICYLIIMVDETIKQTEKKISCHMHVDVKHWKQIDKDGVRLGLCEASLVLTTPALPSDKKPLRALSTPLLDTARQEFSQLEKMVLLEAIVCLWHIFLTA